MGERRVQSVMGRDRQRMSMAYRRRGVALNAPIAKFRYRFLFVRDGRHFHVVGSPRTNKAFGRASRSDDIPLGSYGFHYRFRRTGRLR